MRWAQSPPSLAFWKLWKVSEQRVARLPVPDQLLLLSWQSCWNEYLTTRIEQNFVLNCTCPIADCPAQPTGAFIRNIVSSPEVISKVHTPPPPQPSMDPVGRLAFWCPGLQSLLESPILPAFTVCALASAHSMRRPFCEATWKAAPT